MTDIAPPRRIETLDVMRGVAVLGILAMNAPGFAMPEPAYFNPAAYGGTGPVDLAAWALNFIVFDGKMRGLFSLLFGASLLLIADGAEARGEDAARVHYSRIVWLGLFGAIHFYLIWWGDILLHYAMVGAVAFLFRNLPLKTLGLWIVVLIAFDCATMAATAWSYFAFADAAAIPGADAGTVATWEAMKGGFGPLSPAALSADLALYRGPASALIAHGFAERGLLPFEFLFFGGPETLALMLAGMALLRTGFLSGEWPESRYRLVAGLCLGVGVAGFAALAWWVFAAGFAPEVVAAASLAGSVPFRLAMILGYAALVVLLARRGGALVARLAAAGRAAFTNYLGTSIVMTGLFYGWGLGLYGSVGRAGLWLAVLAMWALMLAWSAPWLERFRYGPFEWLWRSLARASPQPMQRQSRPNS